MECCQYFLEGNIFSSIIGRALCGLTENTVSSEQRNEVKKGAFQLEGNNGLIFMGVQIELIRKSLCSSPNAAKLRPIISSFKPSWLFRLWILVCLITSEN